MKVKNRLSFYVLSLLAIVLFAIGANFLLNGVNFKGDTSSSNTSVTKVDDTVRADSLSSAYQYALNSYNYCTDSHGSFWTINNCYSSGTIASGNYILDGFPVDNNYLIGFNVYWDNSAHTIAITGVNYIRDDLFSAYNIAEYLYIPGYFYFSYSYYSGGNFTYAGTGCVGVELYGSIFKNCSGLKGVFFDEGSFSTGSDLSEMFYNCTNLEYVSFGYDGSWNNTNLRDVNNMFTYCGNLISIELGTFDTASVTDMERMFLQCCNLESITFGDNFNTSSVTNIGQIFGECHSLTSLDLSSFNTSSVTNIAQMFLRCSSLTSLNLSSFNTSSVTNMNQMFTGCSSLGSIIFGNNFNTSSVTDMSLMFEGCSSISTLDLSNFNTSSVTDMSRMFNNCRSFESLDLSNFNTSSVTKMSSMFNGCSSLENIDFGNNFVVSSVTNFSNMFKNCSSLTSLDLSNFNTLSSQYFSSMFSGCSSLSYLDLHGFRFQNITSLYVSNFFNGCVNLKEICVPYNIEGENGLDISGTAEKAPALPDDGNGNNTWHRQDAPANPTAYVYTKLPCLSTSQYGGLTISRGYVITLDKNGGSDGTGSVLAAYKSNILRTGTNTTDGGYTASITNPTREGYTFGGWTITQNGDDVVINTSGVLQANTDYTDSTRKWTATDKKTVYAKWIPIAYSISYELDGGELGSGITNPTSYTVESNSITLNNPTKQGYLFDGWTGTGLDSMTTTVTIPKGSTGDRAYTANWTMNKVTITLKLDDANTTALSGLSYLICTSSSSNSDSIAGGTTTASATIEVSGPFVVGTTYYIWFSHSLTNGGMGYSGVSFTGATSATATIDYYTLTLTRPSRAVVSLDGDDSSTTFVILKNYPLSFGIKSVDTGYQLSSWSSSNTNNMTITSPTNADTTLSTFTGPATLSANISPISYTITLNGNNGTVSATTITNDSVGLTKLNNSNTSLIATYDSIGKFTTSVIRTGYIFAGWFDISGNEIDGVTNGTISNNSSTTTVLNLTSTANGSVVLYAKWTPIKYTITLNVDIGTIGTTSIASGSAGLTKTNNTTFVATYGSVGRFDTRVTRTGYSLVGWFDVDGNEIEGVTNGQVSSYNSSTTSVLNLTSQENGTVALYAKMTPTVYKINCSPVVVSNIALNLYGEGLVMEPNPTTYTIESDDITLNNPAFGGYTFTGWTGTDLSSATMTVTIPKGSTGNRSYEGTWTPNTYKLTYDLDGGTMMDGVSNPHDKIYTEQFTNEELSAPTKTGYTFGGWYGDNTFVSMSLDNELFPSLFRVLYKGTATFADINTPGTSATIYAKWIANTYTISYAGMDGATFGENHPNDAVFDTEFLVSNPTKENKAFVGWDITGLDAVTHYYGDSSSSNTTTTDDHIDSTKKTWFKNLRSTDGVVTFTAVWAESSYTISYDLNYGHLKSGVTNPSSYNIESAPITLNNPVRDGYTFAGWTGTGLSSPTITVTIPTGSEGSRSYTANWNQELTLIPTWKGTLTYNGASQSATNTNLWNNYDSNQLTIGGTTSGTNVDSYAATFTPKSGYCWSDGTTGAVEVSWNISPRDISNANISGLSSKTYIGSEITQNYTVVDSVPSANTLLIEGTHYTGAFSNNVDVGTAILTLTGIGNYTGTKTANFEIVAATNLEVPTISGDAVYGETLTASVVEGVGVNGYSWSYSLAENGNYTTIPNQNTRYLVLNASTFGTNTVAGLFVKVTVTGTGNYSGSQTSGATSAISQKQLSWSQLPTVDSKQFDGTGNGVISFSGTISGVISGDDCTVDSSSAKALFEDVNFGESKSVVLSGFTLSGINAENYQLSQPTGVKSSISKAKFAVTVLTWSSEKIGFATWTAPESIGGISPNGYLVRLFKNNSDNSSAESGGVAGTEYDCKSLLRGYGPGSYRFAVTANSNNPNIESSDESDKSSPIYVKTIVVQSGDGTTDAYISSEGTTQFNILSGESVSVGATLCDGYNTLSWLGGNDDITVSGGKVTFSSSSTNTESVTLTSSATATVYTITLSLNEKQATNTPTAVVYLNYSDGYYLDAGVENKLSTDNGIVVPTANGYTFDGYYTLSSGGDQIFDNEGKPTQNASATLFTENGTLFAHWTKVGYTITFNFDGATTFSVEGLTGSSFGAEFDTAYKISDYVTNIEKVGSTFSGWKVTSGLVANQSKKSDDGVVWTDLTADTLIDNDSYVKNLTNVSSGAVTLTAQWTTDNYTLTINYYSLLATNSTGLNVEQSSCDVQNGELTASSEVQATVSHLYMANSVSVTLSTANTQYDYYISVDTPCTIDSGANSIHYSWTPSENKTINVYVAQRYTVVYNGNGNDGGACPTGEYKLHDAGYVVLGNNLTKTDNEPNGWNTSANGNGVSYNNGDIYTENENLELFAMWTTNTAKIVLLNNGIAWNNDTITISLRGNKTYSISQSTREDNMIIWPSVASGEYSVFASISTLDLQEVDTGIIIDVQDGYVEANLNYFTLSLVRGANTVLTAKVLFGYEESASFESSNVQVLAGAQIVFVASKGPGFADRTQFVKVYETSSQTAVEYENNSFSLASDVTIETGLVAQYRLDVFAYSNSNDDLIYHNNSVGGRVKIDNDSESSNAHKDIDVGVTKTITATARDGYRFEGWYSNAKFEGDAISKEASIQTSEMVEGGLKYYAKFTAESENYMSLIIAGAGVLAVGTLISIISIASKRKRKSKGKSKVNLLLRR